MQGPANITGQSKNKKKENKGKRRKKKHKKTPRSEGL
jgi:hypothetical protein